MMYAGISAFIPKLQFKDFSKDATKADKSMSFVQQPYNWNPQVSDDIIKDIQKACFVNGKMVEDFFLTYKDNTGKVNFQKFSNAIQALNILQGRPEMHQ